MQIYGKAVTKPGFHWVERAKGHDGIEERVGKTWQNIDFYGCFMCLLTPLTRFKGSS